MHFGQKLGHLQAQNSEKEAIFNLFLKNLQLAVKNKSKKDPMTEKQRKQL